MMSTTAEFNILLVCTLILGLYLIKNYNAEAVGFKRHFILPDFRVLGDWFCQNETTTSLACIVECGHNSSCIGVNYNAEYELCEFVKPGEAKSMPEFFPGWTYYYHNSSHLDSYFDRTWSQAGPMDNRSYRMVDLRARFQIDGVIFRNFRNHFGCGRSFVGQIVISAALSVYGLDDPSNDCVASINTSVPVRDPTTGERNPIYMICAKPVIGRYARLLNSDPDRFDYVSCTTFLVTS